jgi:molybdopterin converting factor small subunit
MARLRLFANLRELAGTSQAEMAGTTVDEVLAAAAERYGDEFGRALQTAQVWVDGTRVERTAPVPSGAEVAVIPPVSGGQYGGGEQWDDSYHTGEHDPVYGRGGYRGGYVVRSPALLEIGLAAALAAALFLSNTIDLAWFTVAVVLVGAMWVYDVTSSAERRGLTLGYGPSFLAVLAGVLGTYRFGAPGMAVAAVGSAVVVLVWGVANPNLRSIESISAGVSIAITASVGSSSLVLLRLRSEEEAFAFLFVATLAVGISWLSDRTDMPVLDPLVAMIVAAVTSGAIAGAVWAPDLLNTVAASVAAALALVAGRNLGTLLRAGGFFVSGPIPGSLHYLDGVIMASGAFWVLLTILG